MRTPLIALGAILVIGAGAAVYWVSREQGPSSHLPEGFVGSASCRSCHERFYELWETSHHGRAMQPFTAEFAATELTPHEGEIVIGEHRYRAELNGDKGFVVETGPDGQQKLPIVHVLGGKNVYYFLTPWERGRLQTLPLAYDVNEDRWFDTAASGVRHFPDMEDAPLHWTDIPYTFNTSCYSCHVSQLTTNYEPGKDAYFTTWAEPGINCETCHGPAGEHVRFCQEDEEACKDDVRLIKTSDFTHDQMNSACAPCHAKMIPLTDKFMPGDRYFDHYDLVALEDRDFYPDGRDLGENYTHTTWMMNPCVKAGAMDCVHCHTSSGRFRHKDEPNNSCAPCHAERVADPTPHTHHAADSEGSKCINCHMPMTTFAHMNRSDHSVKPPTPSATIEFDSPNACNICHTDKDAQWADKHVRAWHKDDYQKPVLELARLLDEARHDNWERLNEMIAYLGREDRDEIYATSFVRLLRNCNDNRKWPALIQATKDPLPLVRSSAADALGGYLDPAAVEALMECTQDEFRVVRIRAAASLARLPRQYLDSQKQESLDKATAEFLASMRTRPDDASSHTNLGNYYMNRGELRTAIESFETAVRLNPQNVATLVNASLAYNLAGDNEKAENSLVQALNMEPTNPAANFNYGLLLGELDRKDEAKKRLRTALKADPHMAAAAYNLCVLEAETNVSRALQYCQQAAEEMPQEPKYLYTLAFFQAQDGKVGSAATALQELIDKHPGYRDAYMLLSQIYQSQGNAAAAAAVYQRGQQIVPLTNQP